MRVHEHAPGSHSSGPGRPVDEPRPAGLELGNAGSIFSTSKATRCGARSVSALREQAANHRRDGP